MEKVRENPKLTPRKIGLIGIGLMTIPVLLSFGIDLGYINTGIPFLQGHARDLLAIPYFVFILKAIKNKSDLSNELMRGFFFSFTVENLQAILNSVDINLGGTWDPWDYAFYSIGGLGLVVSNKAFDYARKKVQEKRSKRPI